MEQGYVVAWVQRLVLCVDAEILNSKKGKHSIIVITWLNSREFPLPACELERRKRYYLQNWRSKEEWLLECDSQEYQYQGESGLISSKAHKVPLDSHTSHSCKRSGHMEVRKEYQGSADRCSRNPPPLRLLRSFSIIFKEWFWGCSQVVATLWHTRHFPFVSSTTKSEITVTN